MILAIYTGEGAFAIALILLTMVMLGGAGAIRWWFREP